MSWSLSQDNVLKRQRQQKQGRKEQGQQKPPILDHMSCRCTCCCHRIVRCVCVELCCLRQIVRNIQKQKKRNEMAKIVRVFFVCMVTIVEKQKS